MPGCARLNRLGGKCHRTDQRLISAAEHHGALSYTVITYVAQAGVITHSVRLVKLTHTSGAATKDRQIADLRCRESVTLFLIGRRAPRYRRENPRAIIKSNL
jgi:hypothetical protein